MTYRAPVPDIVFTMRHVAGFDRAVADGVYGDLSADLATAILEEAGRFHASRTPRGWSDPANPLVPYEQLLYLRQPGYGTRWSVTATTRSAQAASTIG